MKAFRLLAGLALVLGLSACAANEPASRNVAPDMSAISIGSKGASGMAVVQQFQLAQLRIAVPQSLRVSEANVFYPLADIVWRGDPRGDRHAQVHSIISEGIMRGTQGMTEGRPVIVEVEVTRFHSLTEKTRYTIGGVHSVHFNLTLRDAASGAVIDGPRKVKADVKGAGGAQAIAEEQMGRTMRVVIVEHLAEVIRAELSKPVMLPGAEVPTSRLDSAVPLTTVAGLD